MVYHFAQGFFSRVAVNFFGALVPVSDPVLYVTNDDGVVAQVQQSRLFGEPFFLVLAFSKIDNRRLIRLDAVPHDAIVVICVVASHSIFSITAAAANIGFSRLASGDFCFVHNRGTNVRARISILLVKALPRKGKKASASWH